MFTNTEKVAIGETFKDIQPLLKSICRRTQSRLGGDFDDLMSEATMLFLKHYFTHDESKGSFIAWIYTKVTWGLLDLRRTKIEQPIEDDQEAMFEGALSHDTDDWTERLSDKDQALLMYILRMNKPNMMRVRVQLLRMGWSLDEVKESFKAIRKELLEL